MHDVSNRGNCIGALCCAKSLQSCPTLWAYWAPLSMGVSRQDYWNGLPCPSPGDLPDPGIKAASLTSPALAGRFFTLAPPGKPFRATIWSFWCYGPISWKMVFPHTGRGFGMTQAHCIYCASWWCSVAQLCLILCYSMDCSLQGSSVHGISQASSLPFPSPGDLPNPGIKLASAASTALASRFFATEPPENPIVHLIFNLMLQLIW